jgi:hypothetical protein
VSLVLCALSLSKGGAAGFDRLSPHGLSAAGAPVCPSERGRGARMTP